MKKNTKKALQIRVCGKQLFFKYGVQRVSVDEICRVAGVSKKTFYNHFSNKFELAKIIIEEGIKEEQAIFETYRSKPVSFQEKMQIMLERKLENLDSDETEFLKEILDTCDELRPFLMDQVQEQRNELLAFIIEEQNRGEIRKEISPHLVLFLLVDQLPLMWLDPRLDPHLPDPKGRAQQLLDCFVTGISNSQ